MEGTDTVKTACTMVELRMSIPPENQATFLQFAAVVSVEFTTASIESDFGKTWTSYYLNSVAG